MSQLKDLAHHLNAKPICRIIASHEYGIMNLWARCAELELQGFKIDRRWVEHTNRHNNSARYMVYSMAQTKKNQKLFKDIYGGGK